MKTIFTILAVTTCLSVSSQQNLIPNGSFEMLNPTIENFFKNVSSCRYWQVNGSMVCTKTVITSHLANRAYLDESLANCWWAYHDHTVLSNTSDGNGLIYVITPDLFTPYDGTIGYNHGLTNSDVKYGWHDLSYYENNNLQTDFRVFSRSSNSNPSNTQIPGIRTESDQNSNMNGFDCSFPDTKFGTGVYPEDGNHFLAIMDYTHPSIPGDITGLTGAASKPNILIELKEELIEGAEYTFSLSAAQMNQINAIKNSEGWNDVEECQLVVHLGKNLSADGNLSGIKQEIMNTDDFSHVTWGTKTSGSFEADKNWKYLRISFNPVSVNGTKIAGVFLDNIKLYLTCENPQNQCNNNNYKGDLLDVKLETSNATDPLALNDPQQNDNNHLNTVKAIKLDNVKKIQMRILDYNNYIVRYIDLTYPPSQVIWDGLRNDGSYATTGWYTAEIIYIENDCFNIGLPDTKNFFFSRKYTVFSPQITTLVMSGGANGDEYAPAIVGLDNIHELNIKISDIGGSLLYAANLVNPPNIIALNTDLGNGNGFPQVSPGQYGIEIGMKNNCLDDRQVTGVINIVNFSDYTFNHPEFDWTPVPKGNFPCPFEHDILDNYLPPRDCCTGSLYIEEVEINNSFDVNILNDIVFGSNVSFGQSTINNFYAANQIIGEPGLYIPLGADVNLQPGYNCAFCKTSEEPSSNNSYIQQEFNDFVMNESIDSIEVLNSAVYPNPAFAGSRLQVDLLQAFNNKDNEIWLFDGFGKKIRIELINSQNATVYLKLPKNISAGYYTLHVRSGGFIQTFKIAIVN